MTAHVHKWRLQGTGWTYSEDGDATLVEECRYPGYNPYRVNESCHAVRSMQADGAGRVTQITITHPEGKTARRQPTAKDQSYFRTRIAQSMSSETRAGRS